MTTRRHSTSGDARMNPDMAERYATLRGGMAEAAEKIPMPDRFVAEPHPDRGAMILTDTETGRTTEVALCGWVDVRRTLNDLFD